MKQSNFTGTGALLRLFLRRDRFILPVWILLPLLVTLGQVNFVTALPNWQEFIAEMSSSPMVGGFLGPVVPLTLAGAIIWRSSVQGAMTLALASLLTVIRHTRTEEEKGRSELVRAGAVGRHANLTAALILCCAADIIAGVLAAAMLISKGLPAGGALVFGLTIASSGCFFAGVGAISAQLRENAGGARGYALAVYGVGFLTFVINNAGGGYTGLAWITPMAWYRLTRPFAADHVLLLLVLVIFCLIPALAAYALSVRRDLGSGIFRPRLGADAGAAGLRSPLALAWRLHKSSIIGWTVGMVFLGFPIGAIVPSISDSISGFMANIGSLGWLVKIGNREAFMAALIYIISLMSGISVYTIAAVLRLRKEETDGLAEPLLASPVSRIRWMSSHLIIAFAASAFLQLVLGLAAGLGWGTAIGDVGSVLPKVLGMSVSKIPVVWVIAGMTAMLYGLLPRAATLLSWSLLTLFVVIEMLWEAQFVDWATMRLIPFSYVHYTIPISELPILPLTGMICLSAAFTAIGLVGFRWRSIS